MARFASIALVALLCLGAVCASDVVVLTEENFDEVVNGNDFVLVEFYAPWCGHCKSLAPEYDSAAATLKKSGSEIVLAKVDATEERALGEKFGVQGFPTLKFFRSGSPSDYDGPRKSAGIVSWLKKKTGPATTSIETEEALAAFKESGDVVAVAAIDGADADAAAAFKKAALLVDGVDFGVIADAALATSAGLTAPGFTVFQNFDEGRADFSGDITDADAIVNFVKGNTLPLVIPFSDEKSSEIFGNDIKTHCLVFADDSDDEAFAGVVAAVKPTAIKFRGKALFVTVNNDHERINQFFGIDSSMLPTARVVTMGGQMRKYALKDDFSQAALDTFMSDFFDGKLSPDLKSEDVPASQDGPVTVVVGKSFDDVVLDETKDVLVEFYAPWCGHCKSLAPTYDKVGEAFASVPSVVIAKMDATANEHAAVEVEGFPTIKLWKADDKANPVDFSGSRDEDGFIKFMKENAAIPFDLDAAPAGEESGKDEL